MGFALAAAARDRGAHVIAVCGPTSVPPPGGIELVSVRSALEMQQAVQSALPRADAVIMTARGGGLPGASGLGLELKKRSEVLTAGADQESRHPRRGGRGTCRETPSAGRLRHGDPRRRRFRASQTGGEEV
jgi:hypothetical protein